MGRTLNRRKNYKCEESQWQKDLEERAAFSLISRSGSSKVRKRGTDGQDNAAILGDHFGDSLRYQKHSRVIIPLAKVRDCFPPDRARLPVGENGLEAIPDLEAVSAIFDGKKDHHAALGLLWPNSPLCGQVNRELLNGAAVKGLYCDDCDLRVSLLIHFRAERGELKFC